MNMFNKDIYIPSHDINKIEGAMYIDDKFIPQREVKPVRGIIDIAFNSSREELLKRFQCVKLVVWMSNYIEKLSVEDREDYIEDFLKCGAIIQKLEDVPRC